MANEYKLSYTATEIDEKLGKIDSLVATVNGVAPDENGNVNIQVSGGNADQVSVEPAEDDIPKVFFGGALQQTKDEAVVPFRYISKTQDISGYAEIKAQGNSSMSYPKKNQTVKMFKDADCTEKLKVDFKGWGKQNKYVYKANWIDLSHARNVVSARLWGDVVKSRANYAELPELLRTTPNQGAVDGFPVKVYAAGVYQGRYTLNIPKDKWTFNMDDELDNHCVLCGENYKSGCFRASARIDESDWTDEIHEVVPTSIKTRWNEVISFVMNGTDEEFRANLGNYFYIDSLIDYYLFGLASCGLDAFGKNQIYATYDGQKWIASMYDMDSTWGLWWNGGSFVATDYNRTEFQDFKDGSGNLLYIRLEQLFKTELQTRWAELKNGALTIENVINMFERFTDIAPAELVAEDYASTTGNGAFTGIPSKTTNNIQQIRAFALARLAWADGYVSALTDSEQPEQPDIPCTGITIDNTELTFDGKGTQTLTATVTPSDTTDPTTWSSDNETVATVKNGVVTAKGNGSAVITASCGNYSANCTVIVRGIVAIPYGVDVLKDAVWEDGYYYKDTNGIKTVGAGNAITDKFHLHDCLYEMSVPAATDNLNKLFILYVWDSEGKFITNFGVNQKTAMTVRFVAKPEYQYALRTNYLDAKSIVTIKPVDRSENAVPQFSIYLKDLTWRQASNGKVEAINLNTMFAEYGVTPSNYTEVVNAANMMLWVFDGANTPPSTGVPVDLQMRTYVGNLLLSSTVKYTLSEWQAYLDENNPVLVING